MSDRALQFARRLALFAPPGSGGPAVGADGGASGGGAASGGGETINLRRLVLTFGLESTERIGIGEVPSDPFSTAIYHLAPDSPHLPADIQLGFAATDTGVTAGGGIIDIDNMGHVTRVTAGEGTTLTALAPHLEFDELELQHKGPGPVDETRELGVVKAATGAVSGQMIHIGPSSPDPAKAVDVQTATLDIDNKGHVVGATPSAANQLYAITGVSLVGTNLVFSTTSINLPDAWFGGAGPSITIGGGGCD